MKVCRKCRIHKIFPDFPNDKSRKDGKHPYCRQCHSARWRSIPKDAKYKKLRDKINRKFVCDKYNMTTAQYDEMLQSQDGLCAICKSNNQSYKLSIDHCHITERVRGLLCINCNTGLGKFSDSIEMLKKAIEYLEN